MIECIVERELNAPFGKLWAIVSNFGDLSWYETAEQVETIGEGIGQTLRIHIAGIEPTVDEVLDAIDDEAHSIRYRVLKGELVPFDDYTVTASLRDTGNGKTHARWYASYGPGGMPEADALALMQGNYTAMLDMLERAAAA